MEVRDQGACGSCYAMAAASSGGARLCLRKKREGEASPNVPLSAQDMISCGSSGSPEYLTPFCDPYAPGFNLMYTGGCDGGNGFKALHYMHHFGLADRECAPYVSGGGDFKDHFDVHGERVPLCSLVKSEQCSLTQAENKLGVPVQCPRGDVECIKAALLDGPVTAAMTVTNAFFTYPAGTEEDDGVFYRKDGTGCGTSGDKFHHHAVTLYGWGTSKNGMDYWLGRNSWGDGWGLEGFFKIRMGNNEVDIESLVLFNVLDVKDKSAYESDCVKIEDLPTGCKFTNVCEDVRHIKARFMAQTRGDQCVGASGETHMKLNPGAQRAYVQPDSILCAVLEDISGGPYDATRYYKDNTEHYTQWLADTGQTGKCILENTYDKGNLDPNLVTGYERKLCCADECIYIHPGRNGVFDEQFCSQEACEKHEYPGALWEEK